MKIVFALLLSILTGCSTQRPENALFEGYPRTLLTFWSTWCHTCKDDLRALNEIQDELASEGIKVIAVSGNEDDQLVTEHFGSLGLSLPLYRDVGQVLWKRYKIKDLPSAVLVNPQGRTIPFHDPEEGTTMKIIVGAKGWNSLRYLRALGAGSESWTEQ